jgi:TolA-binding protein
MQRLRAIEDSDPAQALDLARDGDRRFPKSRDSAERAMIEVKSLAREGKLSEARGAAEVMVNQYPGTPWALEVERHTGAHPHVRH